MKRTILATALGVALALLGTAALAARNSSGTYALPAGNPVVSGTTISTSWANNTLGDLATELTDSLSRSGKGGMTAPVRCADGTVSAPALSWTSNTNTGLYRIGADNVGLALGGVKKVDFATTGATFTDAVTVGGLATLSSGIAGTITDGATTEIASNAIRVKDLGVTTAKLAANAVTRAKQAAVGEQVSTSSGNYSTTTAVLADVTNLAVTITTTGRPVLLIVQPDGASPSNASRLCGDTTGNVNFVRDSTSIATFIANCNATVKAFETSAVVLDVVGAGTYTYKIQVSSNGSTMYASYLKLVAFEL